MKTLRTIYSKVINMPSGSEAGRTERQEEVVHLLPFLHAHVRPRKGKTNLNLNKSKVCSLIVYYSTNLQI